MYVSMHGQSLAGWVAGACQMWLTCLWCAISSFSLLLVASSASNDCCNLCIPEMRGIHIRALETMPTVGRLP